MPVHAYFEVAGVVLLFATLVVAAVTDLLHRKVYNWLTVPAALLGLALAYLAHGVGTFSPVAGPLASVGLLDRLAGLALGFGVFAVAWFGRGVGGGDVKLVGAIGAIAGFQFIISAMFWSGLIAMVMALWILVGRNQLVEGLRRSVRYAFTLRTATAPQATATGVAEGAAEEPSQIAIPYGVAISFGSLLTWFLVELPRA